MTDDNTNLIQDDVATDQADVTTISEPTQDQVEALNEETSDDMAAHEGQESNVTNESNESEAKQQEELEPSTPPTQAEGLDPSDSSEEPANSSDDQLRSEERRVGKGV